MVTYAIKPQLEAWGYEVKLVEFSEGLFLERSYDFINWVVVKSADVDQPFAKDVVAAYNSAEFKAYAAKCFAGYKLPQAWTTVQ